MNGDEHELNAAPSRLHWNVEPLSVDVNENVGVLSLVRQEAWG